MNTLKKNSPAFLNILVTKKAFGTAIIFLVIVFSLPGCFEHRYYQQNHHHSSDYEQRHHAAPSPDADMHNHN
ncbi:MAG TPA: hypothetical protein VKR53_02895 [Puia sp.]|nr:hypothetical protein [Puia sp.]